MLKPTAKEKNSIRLYYANSYYKLKFTKDGFLMAKRTKESPYGILYTPYHLESHIEHIRRKYETN